MRNMLLRKLQILLIIIMVFNFASCVTDDSLETSTTDSIEMGQRETIKSAENAQDKRVFTKESFVEDLKETLSSSSVESALAIFENLPEDYSSDPDLNFLHASLLVSDGEIQKSSKIVKELMKKEPLNEDYLLLAAMVEKKAGNGLENNNYLKKILEINPKNPYANVELANGQMIAKNYKLAKLYYIKALQSDPENEQALFGYGQVSYYLDNLKDSLSAFKNIVNTNPSNAMAWSYLGKVYAESENYKDALPCAKRAIELQPGYYHHWIEYSNYLRYTGLYDEAIEALTSAIELRPEYFLAYAYRAGLYDQKGESVQAIKDYLSVVKYRPDYYFAYESIGVLAWGEKKWKEARLGFEKAYEIHPDSISYPLLVAACLWQEKGHYEVKKYLAKVLRGLDRSSLEYAIVRMYHDNSGETPVLVKVQKEPNRTKRGKFLFYMALFYDLNGCDDLAQEFYLTVEEMQTPLFFEYRLNEWALNTEAN